jgi:hypothetical protein
MYTETITLEIGSVEVNFIVTFDYTPEIKGVYDALPQDCYPTEPEEFELASIVHLASSRNCDWLIDVAYDQIIEKIKDVRDEY